MISNLEDNQIGNILQIGNQDGILSILLLSLRHIKNSHFLYEYNGILLDNTCYVDLEFYKNLDNVKILVGEYKNYDLPEIYYSYLILNQSQEHGGNCYFNNEDINFVFRIIQ